MKRIGLVMLVGIVALVAWAGFAEAAGTFYALSAPERATWGATHCWELKASDLAASTSTNTALATTVTVVNAKEAVVLVAMKLDTAFDTANTNYTGSCALKIGDGSDDDLFFESTELASDGTEVFFKFGRPPAGTSTIALTFQRYAAGLIQADGGTNVMAITNATAAATTTTTDYGQKYYSTAGAVVATLTPNSEEALSANASGKVRVFFRRMLTGD